VVGSTPIGWTKYRYLQETLVQPWLFDAGTELVLNFMQYSWYATLFGLFVIGILLGLLPVGLQISWTIALIMIWTDFFINNELSCGTGLFSVIFFLFASCSITSVMWLETLFRL